MGLRTMTDRPRDGWTPPWLRVSVKPKFSISGWTVPYFLARKVFLPAWYNPVSHPTWYLETNQRFSCRIKHFTTRPSHQFLVAVDMKKHLPPQLCQPGLQRAWAWVRPASITRRRIMLLLVLSWWWYLNNIWTCHSRGLGRVEETTWK